MNTVPVSKPVSLRCDQPNPARTRWLLRLAAVMGSALVVALAVRAADRSEPANPGVPVGSILAFAGPTNTVPEMDGWLPCDGREVMAESFALLYKRIGVAWGQGTRDGSFRLPDLRGRFLRGVDLTTPEDVRDPDRDARRASSAGGNPGNQVGSLQDDDVKKHAHPLLGAPRAAGPGDPGSAQVVQIFGMRSPDETAPDASTDNAVLPSGGESRPKNAAVNWIIKVR